MRHVDTSTGQGKPSFLSVKTALILQFLFDYYVQFFWFFLKFGHARLYCCINIVVNDRGIIPFSIRVTF